MRRKESAFMSKKGLIFYIVIEALLLCLIEICKIAGWDYTAELIIMYAAILLCTILAAYHFYRLGPERKSDGKKLIGYALFTTCAADLFMSLLEIFIPGVIFFCLVQIIYALYLRPTAKSLTVRAVLLAVSLTALYITGKLDLTNALGVLDLTLILVNVIIAWTPSRAGTPLLFRIGMILFLCGDFAIAFRDLTQGDISFIIDLSVWAFYIPSQVLIMLAYLGCDDKKKSEQQADKKPLSST